MATRASVAVFHYLLASDVISFEEPRAHGFRPDEAWDRSLEERAEDAFRVMRPAFESLGHDYGNYITGPPRSIERGSTSFAMLPRKCFSRESVGITTFHSNFSWHCLLAPKLCFLCGCSKPQRGHCRRTAKGFLSWPRSACLHMLKCRTAAESDPFAAQAMLLVLHPLHS